MLAHTQHPQLVNPDLHLGYTTKPVFSHPWELAFSHLAKVGAKQNKDLHLSTTSKIYFTAVYKSFKAPKYFLATKLLATATISVTSFFPDTKQVTTFYLSASVALASSKSWAILSIKFPVSNV